MTPLVEIRDLHTRFRTARGQTVRAVDGVSLAIARNTVTGLVGESGSGKSTLGKTVAGLLAPSAGEILYDGRPLAPRRRPADFRRQARAIQMVFQDPYASLNPRMTVGEILCEPLRLHDGGPRREHRALAARWLERVGLAPAHAGRYPHEFSGGQRQRIGIARALALNPKFIVCDEPVSALDVSIQSQVLNLLNKLQDEYGLTYLFIAHNLSVVEHISDRIGVMYLGKMAEITDRQTLYRNPLHPYTKALLSAIPSPNPRIRRERIVLTGDVPSPLRPPSGCRFHPRCPIAVEMCKSVEPAFEQKAADHWVACHLVPASGVVSNN